MLTHMKKAFVLVPLVLAGCMNVQITPSSVSIPVKDIDVNKQYKVGKACSKVYLGIGPFGDMSIPTAARNGGITKIALVDYEARMYVVYAELCTIVKGE